MKTEAPAGQSVSFKGSAIITARHTVHRTHAGTCFSGSLFFLPILDNIKSLKQEHRLRIRVCACAAVIIFFMACACGNRAECVKKKKASGAGEIE